MESLFTVGVQEPLNLSDEIFLWVLMPILAIICLVSFLRSNITSLAKKNPKKTRRETQESHYLFRAKRLKEAGDFFDFSSFSRRRDFFCSKTNGVFNIRYG